MTSVYDQLNGQGPDYDYWLALAGALEPAAIIDLGCGTGQLTVLFAQHGFPVVGIDPSSETLEVARTRPGHESVTWIDGYATDLATASADLVTMTGHVSQVFLSDEAWLDALHHIRRSLRPGGRVAFDMRNPHVRPWAAWNPEDSLRSVATASGPAQVWLEVTGVHDGLVTYATTTRAVDGDQISVVTDVLRFRDENALRESLAEAGFSIEQLHGDWLGSALSADSPELIVTARRIP